MTRLALFVAILFLTQTVQAGWTAKINTPTPTVPFASNSDYEFGNLPTNLPSGGQYGGSQFVATEYIAWVDEWVESCGGGQARVLWDGGGTVSEGIAYGMILAAYAGDKDQLDALWAYYKASMDNKGLMNWHMSGCTGISGSGGATDAEMDAAMALIIAEYQWPDLNSPYDYRTEAEELITAVKDWEVQPASGYPGPYQVNPGGNWGFNNSCRNPGYIATGYIKAWGEFIPSQTSFWLDNVIPANYSLIMSNAHATTGLASDWCQSDGTPGGCGDGGSFGDDASRFPWRMGIDALWYGDSDAGTITQRIADYTSSNGRNAYNSGGFIPLSGGAGTVSPTFTSMFAVAAVARGSQSHINDYYDALAAMNTSYDQGYFPEILRQIGLFVLTGNFWKPGAEAGGCSKPDLGDDASLCGVGNITLDAGLAVDGTKTFQWYRNGISQGAASTSANTRSISLGGTWSVVVDSLGECSSEDEIIISTTLPSLDLGGDVELCDPATVTLDGAVSGAGITYSWTKNGATIDGETTSQLTVSSAGTYALTIAASGCGSASEEVTVTSLLPVTTGDTICTAGTATISVVDEGGIYEWYTNEGDVNPVFTGATYQPTVSGNATYYVKDASSFNGSVGPDAVFQGQFRSADDTYGLTFEVYEALTIDSVSVAVRSWNNSTVSFVVRILDENGSPLQTSSGYDWNGPGGSSNVEARIPVGLTVDPGSYRIDLEGTNMNGNNVDWQSSGASYPYNSSPNGLLSITGSYENANDKPTSYAFLYDWAVSSGSACAKAPVSVVIDGSHPSCSGTAPTADFEADVQTVCVGESVTFTDLSSDDPTSWSWDFGSGASLTSGTTGAGPHTVSYSTSGTKTVVLTATNNMGSDAETKTAYIQVNPTVSASVAIAGDDEICSGENASFSATPTNGGTPDYQWKVNGANVGTNSSTFSSSTLDNGDELTVAMTSDEACVSTATVTSNTITMTVQPSVAPTVSIVGDPVTCGGESVTFTAEFTNGGNSPTLQWKVNNGNVGTGATTYSAIFNDGDEITVELTSDAACANPTNVTANAVSLEVGPPVTPTVSIDGPTSICELESAEFVATPTGGGTSPSYQWQLNGENVGTDSPTLELSDLNASDEISITLTSSEACAAPTTATNTLTITEVVAAVTPTISISGDSEICNGETVNLMASPENEGGSPTYAWTLNGQAVGSNSSSIQLSNVNNGDVVAVMLTSSESCVTTSNATSEEWVITVTDQVTPQVSIAGENNICAGELATFTATPTNGGSNRAYQWKVNGGNTGTNGATFSTDQLNNGDNVSVVLTTSSACASVPTAQSNAISVTVNSAVIPTVVLDGPSEICTGETAQFATQTSNAGESPSYSWSVNGEAAGSNSTFNTNTLSDGDVIEVTVTSSANCADPTFASDDLTISVLPAVTPVITIVGTTEICEGTSAEFSALGENGGNATYQWLLNGNPVGNGTTVFSSTTLENGDQVQVIMQSDLPCANPDVASSNTLEMTVNTPNLVEVTIAGDNVICGGENASFTSTITNGGDSPQYDWKINGESTGVTTNTFSSTTLLDGDMLTLDVISNAECVESAKATSNSITMQVGPPFTPTVTIEGPNELCEGESVTYTASPQGGGETPTFEWLVNGNAVGETTSTFSSSTLVNGEIVSVNMESSSNCANPKGAASNEIVVTVNALLEATLEIQGASEICAGEAANFNALVGEAGVGAQVSWTLNDTPVQVGTSYSADNLQDGDVIGAQLTTGAGCFVEESVTANAITISVGDEVTPTALIAAAGGNEICEGETLTFNSQVTNEGNTPNYEWRINGQATSDTESSVELADINDGDIISLYVTSSSGCADPASVLSNQVVVTVNAPSTPTVSISGDQVICGGEMVTFSSNQTLGGSAPTYQWKVNGENAGTNANTFSFDGFVDGDEVALEMTSDATCVSQNTVSSNTIVMEVGPPLTPVVTIEGNEPICSDQSLALTAATQGGGTSPSFIWKVNDVIMDETGPSILLVGLNDGDQIDVELTSNAFCAIPAVVDATPVIMEHLAPQVPAVGITGSTEVCEGTESTFTAEPVNGGTQPVYTWAVNGNPIAGGSELTTSVLQDGDVLSVTLLSNATCVSPNEVTNQVTISAEPSLTPTVSLSGTTELCEGSNTTLQALTSGAGNSPTYQWYLNDQPVGNAIAAYELIAPTDGDEVYVEVSAPSCGGTAMANSQTIAISHLPQVDPTVSITGPEAATCKGQLVTFTSNISGGGNNPSYQWLVNNNPVGINADTYSTASLNNGDQIALTLTSSASCVSESNVTSEVISVAITPTVNPAVIINGDNTICEGESTSFTALPVNAGSNPEYDWQVNGISTGEQAAIFSSTFNDDDVVQLVMVADVACANVNQSTSNKITLSVQPGLTPEIEVSTSTNVLCEDQPALFEATVDNAGNNPTVQWLVNGQNTAATGLTYAYVPVDGDQVAAVVHSSAACPLPVQVTSAPQIMTVDICSGLEESLTVTGLTAYPNPARDQLHINITDNNLSKLVVYDILGNTVAEISITTSNLTLNVSQWPKAVYVLKAMGSQRHYIEKITVR